MNAAEARKLKKEYHDNVEKRIKEAADNIRMDIDNEIRDKASKGLSRTTISMPANNIWVYVHKSLINDGFFVRESMNNAIIGW